MTITQTSPFFTSACEFLYNGELFPLIEVAILPIILPIGLKLVKKYIVVRVEHVVDAVLVLEGVVTATRWTVVADVVLE